MQGSRLKRKPFSDDELARIFKGDAFTSFDSNKYQPHHYWAPLIALFTGIRPAETGALEASDIREVESNENDNPIYIFDINTHDGNTRVKAENAIRHIPIHPTADSMARLSSHIIHNHRCDFYHIKMQSY